MALLETVTSGVFCVRREFLPTMYTIYRIFEDDYGCEERPEDQPDMVLVLLRDENGCERLLRVEDALLRRLNLDEGSAVALSEDETLSPLP